MKSLLFFPASFLLVLVLSYPEADPQWGGPAALIGGLSVLGFLGSMSKTATGDCQCPSLVSTCQGTPVREYYWMRLSGY
jgi:hypothetical protein